ncbi:hypothetical protein NKI59_33110 [Mesorhizobium sp. M0598]|uniref:hypothetical protein n=1 Tax=Mesorhizobium sp. M0598 TaxID=2956968 RepID=UPI0033388588
MTYGFIEIDLEPGGDVRSLNLIDPWQEEWRSGTDRRLAQKEHDDGHLGLDLTDQEKSDLIEYLKSI